MARTMQAILEKEKILTHPMAVVNRAGGSGAIAFAYVNGKKGDPHVWLTATTSFLQTPLTAKSKFNYKDFTPLANLAYDDFLIVVNAKFALETMKDLINAARKNREGEGCRYHCPWGDAILPPVKRSRDDSISSLSGSEYGALWGGMLNSPARQSR
jgi:tripartite-type tricarboxylate transporter receptor subunit TctC